jgi:RNA polymerase sigma-70 factor (ECF subfamily)
MPVVHFANFFRLPGKRFPCRGNHHTDMVQQTGSMPTEAIDWQATLAKHDRWLRTVVAARLGQPNAVEDVMQEVALAAVRQRAPINDPSKVAPWLYRLAVMNTLMYRRKMGRRRKLTNRYAEKFQPTERDGRTPEPLDWMLADERRAQVRQALADIPPRDAEILLLKYTEDWSYVEIAKHLGISESAVEARLHRARKRMRDQLTTRQVVPE